MAKKKTDYVVVYVFGPLSCKEKYLKDEKLSREAGEWVKIGLTGFEGDIEKATESNLKETALKRVLQEPRTGIPVPSSIYDVFVFPRTQTKTDDLIRNRLCVEVFELENSNQVNKEVSGEDVIPAGREFVYGVCRSNIKYAVQSYDHDLIVSTMDNDLLKDYIAICRLNDICMEDEDEVADQKKALSKRKSNLNIDLILNIDDTVVLTDLSHVVVVDENGDAITAKYMGNKKFKYREEIGSASGLARILLKKYTALKADSVSGTECWTFNGKKLSDYRI